MHISLLSFNSHYTKGVLLPLINSKETHAKHNEIVHLNFAWKINEIEKFINNSDSYIYTQLTIQII